MSADEMLKELLNIQDIVFTIKKFTPAGIVIEVETEEMILAVKGTSSTAGWITTRVHNKSIAIEPYYPPSVIVLKGTTIYHVSDSRNRWEIMRCGLKPTGGGNTSLNRTYPERLHLAQNLSAAFEFIYFQTRPNGSLRPRIVDKLDLYEVTVPEGYTFYQDSHFQGGIWTETTISTAAVRRIDVREWRPHYDYLYPPPDLEKTLSSLMVNVP
ncbi:hypothetical protein [Agrobacterium sp.]|uniref:hypothetical protein n=1 Tax=Agrobacterium sp. TaxID=361 RepID=UPI002899482E|nr:hypothetical protein [Agrobacterium sp.]